MESTLTARFARIASSCADRKAIVFREERAWRSWSYRELSARVGAIARQLSVQFRDAEVGARAAAWDRGSIAVLAHRHPDTIAAMLAALELGCSYLPLDPRAPPARAAELRREAGCIAEVEADLGAPAGTAMPRLQLLAPCAPSSRGPAWEASGELGSRPAYVMFTSGSTGEPKGVLVPHRAILRLVCGQDYLRFDATRVFLQAAPLDFDGSTLEIYGPLLHGGSCVLHPADSLPTPASLRQLVEETGVTTVWLTASLFHALVDLDVQCLRGIEELIAGGEALSVPHVRRAMEALPGTRFVNGYGPTENTTFTTCYEIPRDLGAEMSRVPVGRPIRGTLCWIVDDQLEPVPRGGIGELVAAGDGLALGYTGAREETARRFVDLLDAEGRARRGYRTGDLAVERSDGTFDVLGRLDDQIKLHGYRIEPAEVEAALQAAAEIRRCHVGLANDAVGGRHLVAYVVADGAAAPERWQRALAQRLPAYMIPTHFVQLRELPLTSSGKLDRRSLPSPFPLDVPVAAPPARRRDAHLEIVERVWYEVLGRAPASIDTNFFEAGGRSLDALRLHALLEQRLSRVLEPTFVYEAPTQRRQASALAALAPSSACDLSNADRASEGEWHGCS